MKPINVPLSQTRQIPFKKVQIFHQQLEKKDLKNEVINHFIFEKCIVKVRFWISKIGFKLSDFTLFFFKIIFAYCVMPSVIESDN